MLITAHTFRSLDGVMQGPGTPDEDRTDGFANGGWSVAFSDEEFLETVVGEGRLATSV